MSRHQPMETTGTGKGSKKRKSADDEQYRKNLAKVKPRKQEGTLPFKLTINGEQQNG